MADLDKLKSVRSRAQASFTKRAHTLTTPVLLEPTEILREWKIFRTDFSKVTDAGYEYAQALRESADEEVVGSANQIDGKTAECENKFLEVKKATQEIFWTSCAKEAFFKQAKIADLVITQAEEEEVNPQKSIKDRRLRNRGLEREVTELGEMLSEWKELVPGPKALDLRTRHNSLKKRVLALSDKLEEDEADQLKGRERNLGDDGSMAGDLLKDASFRSLPDMSADLKLKSKTNVGAWNMSIPHERRPLLQQSSPERTQGDSSLKPQISLERARLPTFSGDMRDYYRWKTEWEDLQELGNPQGAECIKKFHLLNSLHERVKKDLVLSSCGSADEMFRLLDSKYGNKGKIVLMIINEIQSLPPVKGNNPRRTIELIQAVERALSNLQILGEEDAVRNRIVAQSLESKLPSSLKKEWIMHKTAPANRFSPMNHFDCLLGFLMKQEEILEELDQLEPSPVDKGPVEKGVADHPGKRGRKAFTKSTVVHKDALSSCIVCEDESHAGKLFACKVFREQDLSKKRAHVKKLGLCYKCLRPHPKDGKGCTSRYLCPKADCRKGGVLDHNYLLCPKSPTPKKDSSCEEQSTIKFEGKKLGLTSKQEEFLAELTAEQREKYKNAFSNRISSTVCAKVGDGLQEHPVVMMLMGVTTNSGCLIGALIDLASDTNYITNETADHLGLCGENIKLIVHGVGGMKKTVLTKRYSMRLKVKTSKGKVVEHRILCYGLENIAEVSQSVTAEQLQKFFPNVPRDELVRPKKIDLLISHREGRLVPQPIRIVGDLVLWDGPLGKTVGGTHPDLMETVDLAVYRSETHLARTMRTASMVYKEAVMPQEEEENALVRSTTTANKEVFEWFRWDSIRAACSPQCGGCKCGGCPPGGKEMTLKEERDLEKIKECLTYKLADKHSNSPHWDTAYPWKADLTTLPDNRQAVEATFRNTEKHLEKEPVWKAAYKEQVHEMVSRGAAVKLTREEIDNWKGPKWYISNLVAPNPHSSSTPVRIVWNSSQEFRGISLNGLLHKGPDVLNPIRGVLLRFRSGLHAALGDVKKMYNSVWLKDNEVHLHRFLWRDNSEGDIEEFAVVRVNIGDKPAGCIAQVAMKETANLPQFADMIEERRALTEDSYVDDILTSHNDLKTLERITKGVEEILKAGGFFLKPWVLSHQSGRGGAPAETTVSRTLILPNQMHDGDNKALGVGYEPETDKLRLLPSINFSKKRGKMRTGFNLSMEDVREGTPNPLTRRMLLSQIAALYDPIGLASPTKQKGVMLVRESFQEAGKNNPSKDTWDAPLSPKLREAAITLFEEYVRLGQVRFERSLTPPGAIGQPVGITFSDGSESSYGAVLYLRWKTRDKVVVKLVESKAKLTPLDQKGDVIKAELCGAVFATRLKKYFEKHCHIKAKQWIHFVDSQTILAAIQKDSYGYQTFFANRIGEIQKAGHVEDWRWIEGRRNIADILTRGATPEELNEGLEWQQGPEFLKLPKTDWPMKTASEITSSAAENVVKLQRKAFSAVITRSQSKERTGPIGPDIKADLKLKGVNGSPTSPTDITSGAISVVDRQRSSWAIGLVRLVEPQHFSSLSKLCGSIAWTQRAIEIWLRRRQAPDSLKWEANSSILSTEERAQAFRNLVLAAQNVSQFLDSTLDRLVVYRDENTGILLCGGRIQSWREDGTAVPLIPLHSWLATLISREAHDENHEGVAATLLRTRRKAWIVQGRRIVKKIVNDCVTCSKLKAKMCQQMMSDLPPERSQRANPFEYTTLDLFGPFEIKDAVKRRTGKKVWGIVFCCMASRAVHVDLVDDQSSESFLQAYSRFVALRGHPRKLWSDRGTNFIGAKPALQDLHRHLATLREVSIEDKAAKNGTVWAWNFHPADAPHRNGAAEAAVKLIKRALTSLGGTTSSLTWGELQTLFYQAANLTNERPIDAKAQVQEDSIEYLTPNTLLLGRTRQGGDTGGIDLCTLPWRRLRAIQIGVDMFWKKWSELAGPNLFVRPKWHRTQRNVAIGDIVWIADQNALRGQFRLGRIQAVYPDKKGLVRDADIKVCAGFPASLIVGQLKRNPQQLTVVILRRDVRRLVVLIPVEAQ
ncbi:gag-pol fusion poly [Labeo rohita]|uniref:Gag-pol fusion poly n=1 Tax=Labeo rohita TaxID=84645 RepID=A0A498P4G3_LABRO|nr:gag-pol fusion poly [Labeo rohita]